MDKIVRIGSIKPEWMHREIDVFYKIEIKDGNLSISGVIGPKSNGDAWGGCGQINMDFEHRNPADNDKREPNPIKADSFTFAPGWDKEKWFNFLDIWGKWHLNNMRAGCVHQRENWETQAEIELIEYSWSDKYYGMMKKAENGELTADEYQEFQEIALKVKNVTISYPHVKYPSPLVLELLDGDWIKERKRETKTAGWISEAEHPAGLLSKPCEVCGYKYGTAWLKQDLPEGVVEFLEALPDTDKHPAWV